MMNTHSDIPGSGRILSKKGIRRNEIIHSYVSFFLLGSFLGLAIGNTLHIFFNVPSDILPNFDLEFLSVLAGSCISVLCKIIFSLR